MFMFLTFQANPSPKHDTSKAEKRHKTVFASCQGGEVDHFQGHQIPNTELTAFEYM